MEEKVHISVENVTRIYRDTASNPVYALKNVSLKIRRGEFITFIGPSGCGKTTLLRLIAGLDKPEEGRITINGSAGFTEITGPDEKRGFVFQQPTLFPWATVTENVSTGLRARGVYSKDAESRRKIQEYIDMIGLTGFENSYPHEISGGMAQRVAIIRALINEPEILLLDEPLGALDAFKRVELQNQLLDIWRQGKVTMAMVTHDVDEAICLSQRIVLMTPRPGQIVKIIDIGSLVGLGGIRDRSSDDFLALRKTILASLRLAITAPPPEYTI